MTKWLMLVCALGLFAHGYIGWKGANLISEAIEKSLPFNR